MDFKVTPQELGQRLGIDWSDEQMAILTSDFQHPMLINAVAGAGKTTTLMSSILFNALNDRIPADQVLGITFSKAAATDMEDKYTRMALKARQGTGKPEFKTFHAFFYGIVKQTRSCKLFNVYKYTWQLFDQILKPKSEMSRAENVDVFLNIKDKLINLGYSDNGIDINEDLPEVKSILKLKLDETSLETVMRYLGLYGSAEQFADYLSVIKEYQALKDHENAIDFSDMQTIVWHYLQNDQFTDVIKRYVAPFTQIYLDEFQDISPLQWNLVRKLFPESVLKSMVVVGDDDQSIYSFRGSSPEIILGFQDKIPGAKTYHLSTNYRTGSQILNTAAPMIENNQHRLAKQLKAYNQGGLAMQIDRGALTVSNDDPAMLDMLKRYSLHPDQSFAVLTRFNRDLMVVVDWLASHGIYANSSKKLQLHILYHDLFGLADALYHDDVDKFIEFSNRINGRKFQNAIGRANGEVGAHSIEELLDSGPLQRELQELSSYQYAIKLIDLTRIVLEELTKEKRKTNNNVDAAMVLNSAKTLTEEYYTFCTKKNMLSFSYADYLMLTDYFDQMVKNKTWEEFMIKEEKKKTAYDLHTDKRFSAMTLHGAKGLEWDNVCLYGLNVDMVSQDRLDLAEEYPIDLDYSEFCERLSQAKNLFRVFQTLASFHVSMEPVASCILSQMDEDVQTSEIQSAIAGLISTADNPKSIPQWKSDEWVWESLDENAKQILYRGVMSVAEQVEEERRLLYVGITRAKKIMIIDSLAETDTPLLNELNTDTMTIG